MYQILMRKGTTEYAIHLMFNPTLTAHLPLGSPEKLGRPDFPVPISFFYGDEDWVLNVDEDAAQKVCIRNKKVHGFKTNHYLV